MAEFLISKHADVNHLDKYGRNALFTCDDYEVAKILIANDINVRHLDIYGRNILYYNTDHSISKLVKSSIV